LCISLIAAFLIGRVDHSSEINPHAFKSDGCSGFPNGNWVECCVRHDLVYWVGGTREERAAADSALQKCVADKGHPVIAKLMYSGVRVGGAWWLSTPFNL